MEAVILTILFFALAGLGFGVLWFSKDHRGKRRLKDVSSTPIAEAQEGAWVKVTGTLRTTGGPDLESPITRRHCVGYVVEVKERKQAGANANWVTMVTKEQAVPFVVEDASGRALVKATGAHLVLVRDGHVRSGAVDEHAERAVAFLKEQGTESENILRLKKTVRYEEGVLEPGEEVSVLGMARWETVPASMRTEGMPDDARWLTLDTDGQQVLTISDDPSTL